MKLSIFFLLLISLIQSSYAKLSEDQIAMLVGDYKLVSADEKLGECPLSLSVKHERDQYHDWEQIDLVNSSQGSSQSFQNLFHVDRDHFSELEKTPSPNLLRRVVYETRIQPSVIGFVLDHTIQKQTRDSVFSDWNLAWFKMDIQLILASSEITGNFLTVSVDKTIKEIYDLDIECKYIKFLSE